VNASGKLRVARSAKTRADAEWRRRVRNFLHAEGFWRYSRRRSGLPTQGWKIHVSATALSANKVFARVYPILRAHNVSFKVVATLNILEQLNSGLGRFSQVGKFLTAYPKSTGEATALAKDLHAATRGLSGPKIPYDLRYRQRGIIYYRYGSFGGGPTSVIVDPQGKAHRDHRRPDSAVPPWLNDPFRRASPKGGFWTGPLGPDFIPFKALMQRGKGGVYEALDLSVSPVRLVVIKEGRRHGETAWNGMDGYDLVRREAAILRALACSGIPVPEVLREFEAGGNRYVVLEKIKGNALLDPKRPQPARPSWRRARLTLEMLEPVIASINQAGWVWRDCKPSHIFIEDGRVRLIDFEGACKIDDVDVLPWASRNYAPPLAQDRFAARRKGTWEDDYALGVIAFQLGTGKFPPVELRRRAALYRRTKCPEILRKKIDRLLEISPSRVQ
jgi:hypothetical protein